MSKRHVFPFGQKVLLKLLAERDVLDSELNAVDKGRMHALRDCGYAIPTTDGKKWLITSTGRAERERRL